MKRPTPSPRLQQQTELECRHIDGLSNAFLVGWAARRDTEVRARMNELHAAAKAIAESVRSTGAGRDVEVPDLLFTRLTAAVIAVDRAVVAELTISLDELLAMAAESESAALTAAQHKL